MGPNKICAGHNVVKLRNEKLAFKIEKISGPLSITRNNTATT